VSILGDFFVTIGRYQRSVIYSDEIGSYRSGRSRSQQGVEQIQRIIRIDSKRSDVRYLIFNLFLFFSSERDILE
jgi:hypothetical protein